jgi:hypothetical protein
MRNRTLAKSTGLGRGVTCPEEQAKIGVDLIAPARPITKKIIIKILQHGCTKRYIPGAHLDAGDRGGE